MTKFERIDFFFTLNKRKGIGKIDFIDYICNMDN